MMCRMLIKGLAVVHPKAPKDYTWRSW